MARRRGIILAAGDPPRREAARLLEDLRAGADIAVSCDRFCPWADFVVGDGDGISDEESTMLAERFVRVSEQETNDLEKAFRFLAGNIKERPLDVFIFGATGGREDHAIGNVFRIAAFESPQVHVEMVTDTGVFYGVCGRRTIPTRPCAAVSVFAPEKGTQVSSSGLEWPLDGVSLDDLWSGTLNRALGDSVTLNADRNIIVYVERKGIGQCQERA